MPPAATVESATVRSAVRERRVAQAPAEREERGVLDVDVALEPRPPRVLLVVDERDLPDVAGHRHRELPRRVPVAEEDVGDGGPGLGPGEPRLDDRRDVLGLPDRRERAPVHEHDDRRRAGLPDAPDQLVLGRPGDRARPGSALPRSCRPSRRPRRRPRRRPPPAPRPRRSRTRRTCPARRHARRRRGCRRPTGGSRRGPSSRRPSRRRRSSFRAGPSGRRRGGRGRRSSRRLWRQREKRGARAGPVRQRVVLQEHDALPGDLARGLRGARARAARARPGTRPRTGFRRGRAGTWARST